MKNWKRLPKQSEVQSFDLGDAKVQIVELTNENREHVLDAALSMYANEPCRVCGVLLTNEDVHTEGRVVFAGYSHDNKSRCAHKACWDQNYPKSQWAYPLDAA